MPLKSDSPLNTTAWYFRLADRLIPYMLACAVVAIVAALASLATLF